MFFENLSNYLQETKISNRPLRLSSPFRFQRSAHQPCNLYSQTALGRAGSGWAVSRVSAVVDGNWSLSSQERLIHPLVEMANRGSASLLAVVP